MKELLEKAYKNNIDLYEVLEIEKKATHKEIKKAYKDLARKYHPDKNKDKDTNEKFHSIKEAYDILSDEKWRQEYDEHFRAKKEFEQRVFVENKNRARYANDLLEREEENKKKRHQESQNRQEKILERQKELERLKKEQEEHEFKKKLEREKAATSDREYYKNVNTIKVKWDKTLNVSYTKESLNMIFKSYGPIKEIELDSEKRRAIIEYINTVSAEKAYKDHNKDNEAEEGEGLGFDDGLKVKYLIKRKKREKLLTLFSEKKKEKLDSNINTKTLERIANIFNKTSDVYLSSQMEELKRQKERERIMRETMKKVVEDLEND